MSGAQGLGQDVSSMPTVGSQFRQPSMMSGGLGNQYSVTPSIGQALSMPTSVQRMPGGFGLSPQLLAQIAALQARSPQFTPQQPQQTGGFFGNRVQQIQNPYRSNWPGYGNPGYGGVNWGS